MDIQTIKNIIDFSTDRARYNSGFTSYKRNLVKDSYTKEENSICTFYGTVIDEYTRQNYTSLIMINTKTRAIVNYSCDCKDFISKDNQPKICSHIVATVLKGIDNLENENQIEEEENNDVIDPSLTLTINQSRGGFLGLDLDIDQVNKIEFRKIFNSYKEKKKLHRLSSGGYLNLENEDIQKAFKIIDSLGIYFDFDNMKIPNSKSIYLENIIEQEELSFINGQKYVSNIAKRYKKINNSKYELPTEINAKLRDYQIEGYNFLRTLADYEFGGILADEMGLGKTLQSITFLLSQKGKQSLVITPTALIHNWASEINKFAPTLKIALVHGNKSTREDLIKNYKDYDLILTTYSTYRNDSEKYENIEFDYCFIDEAQNIKNPDSIISKTIKNVNAKVKFALTGTPIENNLLEIWSIFDFVMPGYLYNKDKFKYIFGEDKNIAELKRMIKPFILRRTKKEVIKELPEKIEHKYYVELEKEHKRAYLGFIKLVMKKLKENNQDDNISILSYLTKLRQLALAPEVMVKNYLGKNSKLDILEEIIKDNSDKKILVFSQFTRVLGLIKNRLEENGVECYYLDGKTDAKDRLNLVNEFNNSESAKVFLISLKAGGTGLNLTSASMVVHFDPWWNPSVENQASDRAHRLGQKNVVDVIKLIAKDTVEEKVILLQESKKDLIDNVMDNNLEDSNVLKKLTKDDLIDLFM